jgi:hypothetical protein
VDDDELKGYILGGLQGPYTLFLASMNVVPNTTLIDMCSQLQALDDREGVLAQAQITPVFQSSANIAARDVAQRHRLEDSLRDGGGYRDDGGYRDGGGYCGRREEHPEMTTVVTIVETIVTAVMIEGTGVMIVEVANTGVMMGSALMVVLAVAVMIVVHKREVVALEESILPC